MLGSWELESWEFGGVRIRLMRILTRTLGLFLVVVALAGGGATAQERVLTAAERAEFEQWWDSQPKIPLPYENDGAKVFILEFTDLQCPFCRQKHIELKPI